jgi:hypothetical protein
MALWFAANRGRACLAAGLRCIDPEFFLAKRAIVCGHLNIRIGFVRRIFARRLGFDRSIGPRDR